MCCCVVMSICCMLQLMHDFLLVMLYSGVSKYRACWDQPLLSFIERLSSFRGGKYIGIVGWDSKFCPL